MKTVAATGCLSADVPVSEVAERPQQTLWPSQVAAYLSLTKPRVVGLVLFAAVASAFAAATGVPSWSAVKLLLLTGFLTCGGAAALNHYFDRDIDRGMRRTRRRPLVTGQIRYPEAVLVAGTGMIAVGLLLAAMFNPMLAASLFAGAFVYVAVYTLWLKRRNPLNIVVGGLAGSFAVLGGWMAVAPSLEVAPLLLALLVFLWTPAHFWSLAIVESANYHRAGIPMLPTVVGPRATAWWILLHVLLTLAVSAWLQVALPGGIAYRGTALVSGSVFLLLTVGLLLRPGPDAAWRLYKASGIYLGAIFLGVLTESLLAAG